MEKNGTWVTQTKNKKCNRRRGQLKDWRCCAGRGKREGKHWGKITVLTGHNFSYWEGGGGTFEILNKARASVQEENGYLDSVVEDR